MILGGSDPSTELRLTLAGVFMRSDLSEKIARKKVVKKMEAAIDANGGVSSRYDTRSRQVLKLAVTQIVAELYKAGATVNTSNYTTMVNTAIDKLVSLLQATIRQQAFASQITDQTDACNRQMALYCGCIAMPLRCCCAPFRCCCRIAWEWMNGSVKVSIAMILFVIVLALYSAIRQRLGAWF